MHKVPVKNIEVTNKSSRHVHTFARHYVLFHLKWVAKTLNTRKLTYRFLIKLFVLRNSPDLT